VRTVVKGKNIDVPEPVRKYAERKMRRLERFLDERSEAIVELSAEQHRSAADSQIVSVSLVIDGRTLHSRAAGLTHQVCLDTVIDRIERQAIDFREKRSRTRPETAQGQRRGAATIAPAASLTGPESAAPAGKAAPPKAAQARAAQRRGAKARGAQDAREELGRRPRVVKTKRFAIEPMFEEDALARMEELGHLFFIFVDAKTERLCVLYRRDDGDFGLIEPMIGGEYTAGRSGRKG
jgi:putative sigma-54 modulation protein